MKRCHLQTPFWDSWRLHPSKGRLVPLSGVGPILEPVANWRFKSKQGREGDDARAHAYPLLRGPQQKWAGELISHIVGLKLLQHRHRPDAGQAHRVISGPSVPAASATGA